MKTILFLMITGMLMGCGPNFVGDTVPVAPKTTRDYTAATIPPGETYYTCCASRSTEGHVWLSPFAPVRSFYNPFMYRIRRDGGNVRLDFMVLSDPPADNGTPDKELLEKGYLRVTQLFR